MAAVYRKIAWRALPILAGLALALAASWLGELSRTNHTCATIVLQLGKELVPVRAFFFSDETEFNQCIVKFVCISWLGPHFFTHAIDRGLVELAHVCGRFRVEPASLKHRACAAFFERSIVEVCVRSGVENFLRQRRGLDDVASKEVLLVSFDRSQQTFETVDVHRLFQAVFDRLVHEG